MNVMTALRHRSERHRRVGVAEALTSVGWDGDQTPRHIDIGREARRERGE